MLHVNIKKLHVNIIKLHFDIIYPACTGQKHACLHSIQNRINTYRGKVTVSYDHKYSDTY